MYLYLVQHAEAKNEIEDSQKSLTEKGIKDLENIGSFIAEHINIHVDTIIHSGKKRAEQTAEILAKYLNLKDQPKQAAGLNPLDDPEIWVNKLNVAKEDTMIVGHLPFLNKLSDIFLCHYENKDIIEFSKGGIVCIERFDEDLWSIRWMITPEILK
jgi:phosphohistidine phosphatase